MTKTDDKIVADIRDKNSEQSFHKVYFDLSAARILSEAVIKFISTYS